MGEGGAPTHDRAKALDLRAQSLARRALDKGGIRRQARRQAPDAVGGLVEKGGGLAQDGRKRRRTQLACQPLAEVGKDGRAAEYADKGARAEEEEKPEVVQSAACHGAVVWVVIN